ncbi:hypothetical protein AB0N17_17850 [Streptomyces sp. NPDC051133]|uniref:hypothetical protein n=1 Tax=Streptomyces sp. NPDC051133 TaxID=3155521 RepID=UPI00343EF722
MSEHELPHDGVEHGGSPAERPELGLQQPTTLPSLPAEHEPKAEPEPAPVYLTHYGEKGLQAYNLHLNGDQVIPIPITESDPAFKASQDHRFIPPRNADVWASGAKQLHEYGIIVLCAASGTGRRTAAIRLLRTATDSSLPLFDLEPEWSSPKVQPLPALAAQGYILDLSDLPEEPAGRLGADLVQHGEALRKNGSFLVVLATPTDWYGNWSEPTLPFTVRLESPDAKALVSAELRAHQRAERVAWLDASELTDIWLANPSAREARRLAGLLIEAPDSEQLKPLIDQFGDWHTEVERLLNKDRVKESDPPLLATRVMVWAGALLHGGQRSSVIKAADELLIQLGITRSPFNVLTDATTSNRLAAAKIDADGDRAYHDRSKQGLPAAILRHLWDEFPTQNDLLRKWAVGVAADRTIPDEDARLVAAALLRLAVDRHDRVILDGLANDLKGPRRTLAVQALTEAADNAEFGRYIRDRLRTWMDARNPSDSKIELVIEICGGPWGIQQPALALTRLGKAAGHAEFGSTTLTNAFRELARRRPDDVRKAVAQWLADAERREDDARLRRQTLGAFLALVSSDEGTDLILEDAHTLKVRPRAVNAWQKLLSTDDAVRAVDAQLKHWQERFQNDPDRREVVLDLLADIFTPPSRRSGLDRLMVTEESAIHPFWREVLEQAVLRYGASREASSS